MAEAHSGDPDVLVVGAGASGAAVAWSLARAGFRVVCLEQGDWVDQKTLPGWSDDWELRRASDFNANPNVRRLPVDYPINDSASTFSPLMFNAVGGSTIHWGAKFPRFHPSDFRTRSLDGVGEDWPLTYEELEPFFDLNDSILGVSGVVGDPAQPPRSPRQMPPLPQGTAGARLARAFDSLGWHWWVPDMAINSRRYGEGRGVCNLCGPCDLDCPIGARASADITYWPLALKLGAELRTRCRVREITVGKDGRARGALYYDADGRLHEQRAGLVIVACNGIGTPRLLLNSRSAQFPDGLANRSGLVGKNLMFHVFAAVRGTVEEELDTDRGPASGGLFCHEFYETDPRRGFVRGYSLGFMRQTGPLSAALGLSGELMPWGPGHHQAFAERFRHILGVSIMGDDLPEEVNRVTLDPALTDSHGIPAPKVEYRLGENSVRLLEHAVARATEVLQAAGVKRVTVVSPNRATGWHLLGTCRMGTDPERSVVDRWGRAHDVPNLFLVDGSIFVSGGAVNPTSTLQALALRTADYIARERHNLLARPEPRVLIGGVASGGDGNGGGT